MRKKNQTIQSGFENNMSYNFYFNRLKMLAMSMFEWVNLPETVDERFLELCLFNDGMNIFFEDDVIGFICLRTMIRGRFNVYDIPIEREAYANNKYRKYLTEKDSVIIYDNITHTNIFPHIELYARRLWDLDRTIEINAHAQKTPILITCDERQRLTMKNLYMQYDGNVPVIYGDKNLNIDGIKVLTTNSPFVGDKLYELKNKIWNEALTFLGITNVTYQKKERLISDEVNRDQGGTIASRYARLNARKQAADQINKMFNLNIDVKFRDIDNSNLLTADFSTTEKGVIESE